MARAGEEIYNPVQQDRIVWRRTARDTGGEVLSVDLVISPRGGNPLHVHPRQEEYFKVVSGTFGVQVGDERRWLGEGEEAIVPPGTPHRWWNDSDDAEARVSAELRPALHSEVFFETLYGLAGDGINKDEIYLASPPVPVQKAILATLGPVGRLLGYRDHYQKYSEAEDARTAEPPSARSVATRAIPLVATLLLASVVLLRRVRHQSKG